MTLLLPFRMCAPGWTSTSANVLYELLPSSVALLYVVYGLSVDTTTCSLDFVSGAV
ncbi:hypothetical protein ACVDFE_01470 [Lentzea chajnantorensis]